MSAICLCSSSPPGSLNLTGKCAVAQSSFFTPKLMRVRLAGVTLNNIDMRHFNANTLLTHLYLKRFRYCMYAPRVRTCEPRSDGLSSRKNLLVHPLLRISV